MASDTIKIGVDADRETDVELRKWAKAEGRSKRRLAAVLLRKLAQLRKENPAPLKTLRLMEL
jgi:hypothetical protein